VNVPVVVEVSLREGIADPEGKTIERSLPAMGFAGVAHVRAGKAFYMTIDAPSEDEALECARAMAKRLLSNPVFEQSTVRVAEPPS
jgi:phosphoribosylformylglycinamidine synthase subunit PurS